MDAQARPLEFLSSAYKDYTDFPADVQNKMGFALWRAQVGKKHPSAKALSGFGDAGVLELVEDHRGDTYRAVYTVRFSSAVYVLHAFEKKSKHGIATPKQDIDLVKARLKQAEEIHAGTKKNTSN
jgi:phage-related protein